MVHLLKRSIMVLTDSGGIQEGQTTVLGVPCLTLRNNTERPATVEEGTNILAGTTREGILAAWERQRVERRSARIPALWDGKAAQRSVAVLEIYFAGADASKE